MSTRERSLPGVREYSPGSPFTSTAASSTSSATGQTAPTSSRRFRLSGQPTGRGLELNSARIASISLWAIVFHYKALEDFSASVSSRSLAFCALRATEKFSGLNNHAASLRRDHHRRRAQWSDLCLLSGQSGTEGPRS